MKCSPSSADDGPAMPHSDSAAVAAGDVKELRRSLRDIVALTMLPSVWVGYDPRQICANLVDVVARMVDADGVYLVSPANGCSEILWKRREDDPEMERCLRDAWSSVSMGEVRTIAGAGESVLRLFPAELSLHSPDRFIVAARRPDFPNDTERLVLRVASNQASTWLEWKRAEAEVAEQTTLRRAIEESMLAGVAIVDTNGRQTYVNRAFSAMVGWPEEELIGKTPPFSYWPPEENETITAALQEVIAGHVNPAGYELRFRRRNEERFDALVLISHLNRGGSSQEFLASVYDITERKAAERSAQFLAEAGEILGQSLDYEKTIHAISELVVPRFADWCFIDLVEADGAFRRVAVAHPPGESNALIADRLKRTYPPKNVRHGVSETIAEGRTCLINEVSDDLLISVSRDADHRDAVMAMNIRCFVSVPMTSHGTTFGVVTFIGTETRTCFGPADVALAEEVARRVALAVDNARLYQNAQEANRAKDEFLANLSHELRTPLTAILGWVHLLQLGDLEAGQMTLGLQTIRQSSEAQAKLVDELLDVSRIITGKLQINPVPVVLSDIVRAAVAAIRPAVGAKRQQLQVDIRGGDATVLGDAGRLQQVFWNLLSNAVKFTPPGGVVRVRVSDGDAGNIVVSVEDTGEGIPAEFLPLVFERFRQASAAVHGRSGLGLGLAIAKELIEMHGGTIAARSGGRGTGSTFTVTLPKHSEEEKAAVGIIKRRGRRSEMLRSLRVLLVEDDDATLTLLATVLSGFGAEVMSASSASSAESLVSRFEPQILITDIEMPGRDGVSLLHLLRSTWSATLPAIAVSGYADEASRDRVKAAGFNGFVAKPLDPTQLADEILRALAQSSESGHDAETPLAAR